MIDNIEAMAIMHKSKCSKCNEDIYWDFDANGKEIWVYADCDDCKLRHILNANVQSFDYIIRSGPEYEES